MTKAEKRLKDAEQRAMELIEGCTGTIEGIWQKMPLHGYSALLSLCTTAYPDNYAQYVNADLELYRATAAISLLEG